MTTREHLEAARDLILDPKEWCGNGWGAEGGKQKCALHALEVTATDRMRRCAISMPAYRVLRDLANDSIGSFNDNHSHAEVVGLFNLAIADEIAKEDYENKAGLVEEIINPVLDRLVAA